MKNVITKADIILFIVLLALGLGSPFVIEKNAAEGSVVSFYVDGEKALSCNLNEDTWVGLLEVEGQLKPVDIGPLGPMGLDSEPPFQNVIKISGGKVDVTDATCLGHDCVDAQEISKEGEVIACLPHKLLISIEGNNAPDAVIR